MEQKVCEWLNYLDTRVRQFFAHLCVSLINSESNWQRNKWMDQHVNSNPTQDQTQWCLRFHKIYKLAGA